MSRRVARRIPPLAARRRGARGILLAPVTPRMFPVSVPHFSAAGGTIVNTASIPRLLRCRPPGKHRRSSARSPARCEASRRSNRSATPFPPGVLVTDASGRCVYANPRVQEMLGLTAEELARDGFAPAIDADDRAGHRDRVRRGRGRRGGVAGRVPLPAPRRQRRHRRAARRPAAKRRRCRHRTHRRGRGRQPAQPPLRQADRADRDVADPARHRRASTRCSRPSSRWRGT